MTRRVMLISGLTVAAAALVTTVLLSRNDDAAPRRMTTQLKGPCREHRVKPPPFKDREHPSQVFFAPDTEPPPGFLNHAVDDGLIAVRYRADLTTAQRQRLRALVLERASRGHLIAVPDPDQPPALTATAALRRLECDVVALDRLAHFRDRWLRFLTRQAR